VSSPVLLLSRSEVIKNLDPRALVAGLAEAFQIHAERREVSVAACEYATATGLLTASSLGRMEGVPAYCLKIECRVPARNPSISGLLHLYDSKSGSLLAVMESSHITSLGSALTGALATDLLAGPEADSVALVGNGNQAWLGLRFLMEMRAIERVTLFDLNRRKSLRMAERLKKYEGLEVRVSDSLTEAVCQADIICCSTWSNRPFLFSEMVKPGTHISTLGSDGPGKKELSQELLESSSFFCDDRDLAVLVGALSEMREPGRVLKAELGEVLAGTRPGRTTSEEITVYGAVGLPFVDLVAAWEAYRRARKKGAGRGFEALS